MAAAAEELPMVVDTFRFFAGAARCLEGRAAGEYLAGYTSFVRREPIGVTVGVAPWNYPLLMAAWKIAPALAAQRGDPQALSSDAAYGAAARRAGRGRVAARRAERRKRHRLADRGVPCRAPGG